MEFDFFLEQIKKKNKNRSKKKKKKSIKENKEEETGSVGWVAATLEENGGEIESGFSVLRNASLEEEKYRRRDKENRERNNCGILA